MHSRLVFLTETDLRFLSFSTLLGLPAQKSANSFNDWPSLPESSLPLPHVTDPARNVVSLFSQSGEKLVHVQNSAILGR